MIGLVLLYCIERNNMDERIYCVACSKNVYAKCVTGDFIYPHRTDLANKRFYRCPHCGNYVGTHEDGRPLGTIPTPELRKCRSWVHKVIDSHWLPTRDTQKRKELYADLSRLLGREYHTGELNSREECMKVVDYFGRRYIR